MLFRCSEVDDVVMTNTNIFLLHRRFLDYLKNFNTDSIVASDEAFHWFFSTVVRIIVGATRYKVVSEATLPSEWATVSDEAFGLLILEKIGGDEDWTEAATARRGMGWKKEGIERFNAIYKSVKESRNVDLRQERETTFREAIKADNKKHKRRRYTDEEDLPDVLDDF